MKVDGSTNVPVGELNGQGTDDPQARIKFALTSVSIECEPENCSVIGHVPPKSQPTIVKSKANAAHPDVLMQVNREFVNPGADPVV